MSSIIKPKGGDAIVFLGLVVSPTAHGLVWGCRGERCREKGRWRTQGTEDTLQGFPASGYEVQRMPSSSHSWALQGAASGDSWVLCAMGSGSRSVSSPQPAAKHCGCVLSRSQNLWVEREPKHNEPLASSRVVPFKKIKDILSTPLHIHIPY